MKNKTVKLVLFLFLLLLLVALPAPVLASNGFAPPLDDKVVIGGAFELDSGETIDGDLAVLGGAVTLHQGSTVDGDIASAGGTLNIAGDVNGSVTIMGGVVVLESSAVINGDIVNVGGNLSNQGARIEGSIRNSNQGPLEINPPVNIPSFFTRSFNAARDVFFNLAQTILLAGLAMLVVLIFPRPVDRTARTISAQPAISGGLGLLTIIVAPALLLLLGITIILLPVSLVGILLLGVALVFGWIGLGLITGRALARQLHQTWTDVAAAGIGTLAISLGAWVIGWIPCIGPLMIFLAWMIGLGSVILSRFGTQVYLGSNTAPAVSMVTTPAQTTVTTRVVDTPVTTETTGTVGNFPAPDDSGDDRIA